MGWPALFLTRSQLGSNPQLLTHQRVLGPSFPCSPFWPPYRPRHTTEGSSPAAHLNKLKL